MLALALCVLALPGALRAQQRPGWEIEALNDQGWAEFDFQTGLGRAPTACWSATAAPS